MTEEETIPTPEQEQEYDDFFALTRRFALAGVGAVALAGDELRAFLDRLVERGELAEQEARELVDELAEKRQEMMDQPRKRVKESVSRTLESLDVPTRGDIEDLQRRIDHLSKQVSRLLEQQEDAS